MASLDVSDLILDPDFSNVIIVQRAAQGVTSQGLPTARPAQVQITAVVVPSGSLALNRGADADLIRGQIHVYAQFPLTAGDQSVGPDMIYWNNRSYIVTAVDDFTNFGIGFVDATADLRPTHNQAGQ